MATDFWESTHYRRWIVDRLTLKQARSEDLTYVYDPEHLDFLAIYFANIITRLGKKLQLRQRVIATATVFFRRFYLKNAYCETEPFIVISACIYVAAKAEESPVHIKNVITESRTLFSQHYGVKNFPTDNSKLAEMEFYLVDDLESDLVVYHPYRTLLALCKASSGDSDMSEGEEGEEGEEEEAGEVGSRNAGAGIDASKYLGSSEGKLVLSKEALQIAWSIINDTYRSELCLLYPPHLIAIAAIYLTFILHPPERTAATPAPEYDDSDTSKRQPRRSSRQASSSTAASTTKAPKTPDPITFLAGLNVSLPMIATIAQEIISLYTLWDRYKEDGAADAPVSGLGSAKKKSSTPSSSTQGPGFIHAQTKRGRGAGGTVPIHAVSDVQSVPVRGTTSAAGSPSTPSSLGSDEHQLKPIIPPTGPVTTAMLSTILTQMRETRLIDLALGGEGELLGLPPSAASELALPGSNGLPLGSGVAGSGAGTASGSGTVTGTGSSGASSGASSVVGQQQPHVQQYAINKMLERTMNAYG